MAVTDFCAKRTAPLDKWIRSKVCKKNKVLFLNNESSRPNPPHKYISSHPSGSPGMFVSVSKAALVARASSTTTPGTSANPIIYPQSYSRGKGPCYKGKKGEGRFKCSIIKCEMCIAVGGREWAEGQRDMALFHRGFTKIDKWRFVRDNPDGSWTEAPWELVMFGMCTDVGKARIMSAYALSQPKQKTAT